jgi:hypothetical protein
MGAGLKLVSFGGEHDEPLCAAVFADGKDDAARLIRAYEYLSEEASPHD